MKEADHLADCHVRSHMSVTLTLFANSRSFGTKANTPCVAETAGV